MHNIDFNHLNTSNKYIWGALFATFALYIVSTFYIPLVLGDDPGFGFNVWQSMKSGSDFNTLTVPEAHNLTFNKTVFISWWSPGQYLIPVFVTFLTGFCYERSSLLITLLFTILGLWGWYKIFIYQKYSDLVIAWSLFFILTSRVVTANHFLNYVGGEMLFFGGLPWLLYYFLKYKNSPIRLLLGLLPISLICFFFKTSSSIVLLGICAVPVFEHLNFCFEAKKITLPKRNFWITMVISCSSFIVYYLSLNHFYLNKGSNPTSYLSPNINLEFDFVDIFNFPVNYWTSSNDIFHQLSFKYSISDVATFWPHLMLNICVFCLLIYVIIKAWKDVKTRSNTVFFVAFYCVYVVFMGYYYTRLAEISLDVRHFKILAFLFLPLLLQIAASHLKAFNSLIIVLLVTNTLYSLVVFVVKKREISRYPLSKDGFALKLTDDSCINILRKIDKTPYKNKILFTSDSPLGVEVVNCRKIIAAYPYEFSCKVGTSDFDGCYVGRSDTVYAFVQNTTKFNFPLFSILHNAHSQLIAKTNSHSIYKFVGK